MKRLITALAASTALTGIAFAATSDGTLGDTSTGTLDVTLDVTAATPVSQIQITGLDTVSFTTEAGNSPTAQTEAFCVYLDQTGVTYTMDVTAPPLAYSDSSKGNAPYRAVVKNHQDSIVSTMNVSNSDGTDSIPNLTPSNVVDCGGSSNTNASLEFSFPSAPTVDGDATTTVTIVVSPDA